MTVYNYEFNVVKENGRYELRIYNSEGRLYYYTSVSEEVYCMSRGEQRVYIENAFKDVLDNMRDVEEISHWRN